jgi:PTS system mannose-specific IIA component
MKVGVVVVTHGQLATELLNAAEMIVGDLPHFAAVSIGWHEDVDQARESIGRAIERVRQFAGTPEAPAGVLVLADMFGGTPANLGVTFLDANRVEVLTGVNLAILIKLARPQKDMDLLALAREMREHGRNAIWVASDLLRGEKQA